MFNWFGSTLKHPLSSPRRAREILAALPRDNPVRLLEEVTDWVESLQDARLDTRAKLCALLDEHSQSARRKLEREYFSQEPALQKRSGFVLGKFSRILGNACHACVKSYRTGERGADEIRGEIPLLIGRALNALRSRYKWEHLNDGMASESLWEKLYWLFAYAEKTGISRNEFALYPAHGGITSIEREFLKTLVIAASSPGALPPIGFEIACHVTSLLSKHFQISASRPLTHFVDLATPNPPARTPPELQHSTNLRFFSPGKAHCAVTELIGDASTDSTQKLTQGGAFRLEDTRAVLKHLAVQWQPQPQPRKGERIAASVELKVSGGLNGAIAAVWTSENIGPGGFDAILPGDRPGWESIGMHFFCGKDAPDSLCVIRRMSRDKARKWHAGVEILRRERTPVELEAEGHVIQAALIDLGEYEAAIAVDASGFAPNSSYGMTLGNRAWTLIPIELVGRGPAFSLWRFRIANP